MQDKYTTQATEQVQLLRTGQVCDALQPSNRESSTSCQHGGESKAHRRNFHVARAAAKTVARDNGFATNVAKISPNVLSDVSIVLPPCIAHLPRSQKLNLLCCLCFVLILHGAEAFSAHSSAQQRTAAHSCFDGNRRASAASWISLRLPSMLRPCIAHLSRL